MSALALCILFLGTAASNAADPGAYATPLRMVNLNPFHLLYGVPASAGARTMPAGSTELTVSADMASHLRADGSGAELVLLDGETYRQSLSLRHGLGGGWEFLLDIPAVSHSGGVFDGFIENWHDAFGLPQGDRDRSPRGRLAMDPGRDVRLRCGRRERRGAGRVHRMLVRVRRTAGTLTTRCRRVREA